MAKAILTQILEGKIDTIHRGIEWTYDLPGYYKGLDKDILYDEDKLVAYLKDKGVLLGILHCGMPKDIIDCRAIGRPNETKDGAVDLTEGIARQLQAKILEHRPYIMPDPDQQKTSKGVSKAVAETVRKLTVSLAGAGVPWETAQGIILGAGGKPDEVKSIFDRALEG